jgi:uncharacterized protein (TIGR02466 family)
MHNIIEVFPTPILSYKNFLPEQYVNELRHMLENCEYTIYDEEGEIESEYPTGVERKKQVDQSKSQNILREFPAVKNEIIETFKEYAYNVLKVEMMKLDFKIGSSWGVRIVPGADSIKHTHANYYYSGVLYLTENPSPINFFLGPHVYNFHERFLFNYSEVNQYNANRLTYIPEINEILFFPSHLKHQISRNTSDAVRYSIAFNIHPSGIYGKKDSTVHVEVVDDLE